MDDTERIRVMESSLSRMIDWVGKHDSKASFVFGIATAMLGVLIHEVSQARGAGVFPIGLAGVAAILLAAVFGFSSRERFRIRRSNGRINLLRCSSSEPWL